MTFDFQTITSQAFAPNSIIDTLFDYGAFLQAADQAGAIGSGPTSPKKIGIVGAGAAGLVAAYELSRINNVTTYLYEATGRPGGRMDSVVFQNPPYKPKVFELNLFMNILEKINPLFAQLLDQQKLSIQSIDWENTPYYYGAFKLNYPGQEQTCHDAFFQFQTQQQGVFLAGDSVSWAGGWLEGAMPTGVNAACAALNHVGGSVIANSPLTDIPSNMFTYDNPPQ